MTYNIVQLIAFVTLGFTTGYGIATAIGIWTRLNPDAKNRELKTELAELRKEFHRHVELYGDKARLHNGEPELRYEQMHFDQIPERLHVTQEDAKSGRITRARVMAELKERFTRDWKSMFGWYVAHYGDKARIARGESFIGYEPRILAILFGPNYQEELPPDTFLSHPDPRIEGDPIPKSCKLSPEEALAVGAVLPEEN